MNDVPRGGRRILTPYLVFIIGFGVTLAVASSYRTVETEKSRLRFERSTRTAETTLRTRMGTQIALLRSAKGIFDALGTVTEEQFRAYAESLDLTENYPGTQGIGFAKRVDAADASQLREFGVWPSGGRAEYFPIVYLEPHDMRNAAAAGYDMYSDPVRKAAMERARDTGRPAASGRVTLVQEIDDRKQPGFLVYVPVYRGGTVPGTEAERRDAIEGFVYSPFRAHDFFDSVFSDRLPRVALRIYDGRDAIPENLLYASDGGPGERPRFRRTVGMLVAGRTWTIEFVSLPGSAEDAPRGVPEIILAAGTLISLILFVFTRAESVARRRAEYAAEELQAARATLERRVRERTLELSRANEALKAEMHERTRAEREMTEISEREQQRLGQDIHDGLSQQLTGISYLIKSVEKRLAARELPEAKDAGEISELVKRAIRDTKALSRGLNPIQLESNGIVPALRELADTSCKLFRVKCEAELDAAIDVPDRAVATQLYRIAQEAVHNAVRHGRASVVKISFLSENGTPVLSVADDGSGFEPHDGEFSGMGLRNMRHRAVLIGASLDIRRIPSGGTLVRCVLPARDFSSIAR